MIDFKNIDTISHILKDTSINSLIVIKNNKLGKKESDQISSLYDVFYSSLESNQKIQMIFLKRLLNSTKKMEKVD